MKYPVFALSLSFFALALLATANAQDEGGSGDARERLFRENAPKFHKNFSAGEFEINGPLVTPDIDVDSNNVKLLGRENFVKRIERYSIAFPGMQLRDRIIIVDGNIAAVNYVLQGEQKGPYGNLAPTGVKVEAMSGEVFEFDPQGLMKKLTTVTELDRLEAEIRGSVKVDTFQRITLLRNGVADPERRAKLRAAAAMFNRNFNEGHTDRNAALASETVRINADNVLLEGGVALVREREQRRIPFPDMRITNEYVLADGNRAAVEYVMEGTQIGSFTMPDGSVLPPTGKKMRVRGIDFMEFDDTGLLKELIAVHNENDFIKQLKE